MCLSGRSNAFFKLLLGFTRLDHQRNSEMRGKLKITNIPEELQGYQQNWKNWKKTTFHNWYSVTKRLDEETKDEQRTMEEDHLGIYRTRHHPHNFHDNDDDI
jgi:hypothetical protein